MRTQRSATGSSHRTAMTSALSPAPRRAMTLIEILVVIGIIAILISVIGLVGRSVREKGKRELTRSIMDGVMAAVDEFQIASKPWAVPGIHVTSSGWPKLPNAVARTNVAEPPPVNGDREDPYEPSNNPSNSMTQEDYYLGTDDRAFLELTPPPVTPTSVWVSAGDHVIRSDEGLYVLLAEVPGAKSLLDRLPESAKRRGTVSQVARPRGSSLQGVDPLEIIDAWGNPLRYRGYTYRNNGRPFLWSAGPDGKFAPDSNRVGDAVADPNGYGADDIFSDRKD